MFVFGDCYFGFCGSCSVVRVFYLFRAQQSFCLSNEVFRGRAYLISCQLLLTCFQVNFNRGSLPCLINLWISFIIPFHHMPKLLRLFLFLLFLAIVPDESPCLSHVVVFVTIQTSLSPDKTFGKRHYLGVSW